MKTKILLVEDEEQIRTTLYELLTLNNFEVKTDEDGAKAIESLKTWIPDVIVSDIMMPNCNGYDFYKTLRKNQKYNHIPFIFLTAKKGEEELNKANLIGVDAFITKPFKTDDLIGIIETKIKRNHEIKNNYDFLEIKFDDFIIHEIYSPLKKILGLTNHLNEDKKLYENLKNIDIIKNSAQKLNRTFTNIISYQRLISNNYDFQVEAEIEVQNCFSEIYEQIKDDSKRKFIVNLKKSSVSISRQDLLIVIHEMIDNAIKFSNEDDTIVVNGNISANRRFYVLSIKDTGIGFSEKQIKQIGPFVQFYNKDEEKRGLGLGLFISKKIIQNYHGKLRIVSQKGAGTVMEIVIPVHF